ncbi:MAG: phenylacetate--CoA ligase family protein [Lachnospiraceae bacterium]|nr:phenylacetate--CoA ligase family protein [Lachnospiraceae bacterium]
MDKLKSMVEYAYQKVPLYFQLAEQAGLDINNLEYEKLPIVSKDFFIEKGSSVISSEYMGAYIQGKLLYGRTSGSTGKCSEVYWDRIQEQKSLFKLWYYRKKYYGITPRDKLCYFYPADEGSDQVFMDERKLAISKDLVVQEKISLILKYLSDFEPDWMILQPSFAAILCKYSSEIPKKVIEKIKYIEMTGEYLSNSLKEKVRGIFSCDIANQYGSKEVNSIAYECPQGNMHVMSDNVYIEILGGKEQGDICVTSLQNKVMPFIRYNMEDKGSLCVNHLCGCGNPCAILELIAGRSDDFIKGKDGTRIHAYAVLSIFHHVNAITDGGILQYQIIQKEQTLFQIYLVLDEIEMREEIEYLLKIRLKERFSDMRFDFHIYSHLFPNKNTGKIACFICEC